MEPDSGYPKKLTSLNHRLNRVDSAFMSLDGQTYFFQDDEHVKFESGTFVVGTFFAHVFSLDFRSLIGD